MRRALTICIFGLPALFAQSTVTGSRTIQGSWDASGASATKPAKTGATLPGTCFAGEFFFNTAAGSGQNLYLCNPNNIWAAISGGSVSSVFGRSGAVVAATGDYVAAQVTNAVDATATYSNPAWISALAWSKLTAVPTFFYQNLQANSVNQAQRMNLNFSPQLALTDSAADNSTMVNLAANINANTTGNASTATNLAATPTQCAANNFATGITAGGNANCSQPAISSLTGTATSAQIPANVRARAIGSTFSGGGVAMTVGLVNYFTVPFACTISAWNMTVDTGTATIDVWKTATGTAIPTVANTIAASATPAISSGTALHSTMLTGWTTAVNANDIFAFQLKAVASTTLASLVLECDQ